MSKWNLMAMGQAGWWYRTYPSMPPAEAIQRLAGPSAVLPPI